MIACPRIDPARLTRELGGDWDRNEGYAACPCCQPEQSPGDGALRLSPVTLGPGFDISCEEGCDYIDILKACAKKFPDGPLKTNVISNLAVERWEADQATFKIGRRDWANARPLSGTPGEEYFRSMGITCDLPSSLRWEPEVWAGPEADSKHAILAELLPNGGILSQHFSVRSGKLWKQASFSWGTCCGDAVRLSKAGGTLVVCQSIESGLSLLSGLLKGPHEVWATLMLANMEHFALPQVAGRLIVAADGTEPDHASARSLVHHASRMGWQTSLKVAPTGMLWNDVLRERVRR